MKNKNILITEYLEELLPEPQIELNYEKDYELILAVMLSAQTTDKRVNTVTEVLFKKYPDLYSFSNADINDLEKIIRPIGTFRKKASNVKEIAIKLLEQGGQVPNDRKFLESLPGVGRKTTNVVLSVLFKENFIAVDTHVKRVSIRLGLANKKDDVLVIEKKLVKKFSKEDLGKLHHRMILFGRYYCKARSPICKGCRLEGICVEKNKNYN